jgi:hypothetical protein
MRMRFVFSVNNAVQESYWFLGNFRVQAPRPRPANFERRMYAFSQGQSVLAAPNALDWFDVNNTQPSPGVDGISMRNPAELTANLTERVWVTSGDGLWYCGPEANGGWTLEIAGSVLRTGDYPYPDVRRLAYDGAKNVALAVGKYVHYCLSHAVTFWSDIVHPTIFARMGHMLNGDSYTDVAMSTSVWVVSGKIGVTTPLDYFFHFPVWIYEPGPVADYYDATKWTQANFTNFISDRATAVAAGEGPLTGTGYVAVAALKLWSLPDNTIGQIVSHDGGDLPSMWRNPAASSSALALSTVNAIAYNQDIFLAVGKTVAAGEVWACKGAVVFDPVDTTKRVVQWTNFAISVRGVPQATSGGPEAKDVQWIDSKWVVALGTHILYNHSLDPALGEWFSANPGGFASVVNAITKREIKYPIL